MIIIAIHPWEHWVLGRDDTHGSKIRDCQRRLVRSKVHSRFVNKLVKGEHVESQDGPFLPIRNVPARFEVQVRLE